MTNSRNNNGFSVTGVVVAVVASFFSFFDLVNAADAERRLLDTIEATWKARAEKIRAFKCDCDVHVTVEAGFFVAGNDPELPSGKEQPADDATYTRSISMLWKGRSARIDVNGAEWDSQRKEFVPVSFIKCRHNSGQVFYQTKGVPDYAYASIDKGRVSNIVSSIEFSPLFLLAAPFDEYFGPLGRIDDRKQWQVKATDEELNSADCVVVEIPPAPGLHAFRLYWLDSGRDFVVVRWSTEKIDAQGQRRTTTQMDIEYENDDVIGWRPASWRSTFRPHIAAPGVHSIANDVSFVVNPTLEEESFSLSFEPGTWVQNDDEAGYSWIALADGGRYKIPAHQRNMPYTQLMEVVENTSNFAGTGVSFRAILLSVLLALLAIVAMLAFWRRRKSASISDTI